MIVKYATNWSVIYNFITFIVQTTDKTVKIFSQMQFQIWIFCGEQVKNEISKHGLSQGTLTDGKAQYGWRPQKGSSFWKEKKNVFIIKSTGFPMGTPFFTELID
jgi:hypothetical protein